MQVEVALHPHSGAQPEQVREPVLALLRSFSGPLVEGMAVPLDGNEVLRSHVRHVRVFETGSPTALTSEPSLHVHHLFEDEAAEEDVGEGNEEVTAFQLYTLPGLEFDGLWESLVYDDEVQPRLLRYVSSAMRFSAAGVDGRVIAWNRVVLLHGPPGTGKTSLCRGARRRPPTEAPLPPARALHARVEVVAPTRARSRPVRFAGLAHKLAVRLSSTYAHGHLVEVNAHSLFSKWFSESGKMVMALFARIRELLDDGDAFVCVLVDEASARPPPRTCTTRATRITTSTTSTTRTTQTPAALRRERARSPGGAHPLCVCSPARACACTLTLVGARRSGRIARRVAHFCLRGDRAL
jgi:hypothetical protein